MGCDIHAYIEYEEFEKQDGTMWIGCFAENVDIGRNYFLFSLMAGVRYDSRRGEHAPLFMPRGIPKPLSWDVEWKYTLFVSDSEEEGYCSPNNAEEWVRDGSSEWWDEEHHRITHPDWHSASYLTASELEQVQEVYSKLEVAEASYYTINKTHLSETAKITPTPHGFYVEEGERTPLGKHLKLEAVIAAMKALDGDKPRRSRLVFWFDN